MSLARVYKELLHMCARLFLLVGLMSAFHAVPALNLGEKATATFSSGISKCKRFLYSWNWLVTRRLVAAAVEKFKMVVDSVEDCGGAVLAQNALHVRLALGNPIVRQNIAEICGNLRQKRAY